MSLYFFINHILRRFVAKSNPPCGEFAELSSLDEKELAILEDSVFSIYPFPEEGMKSIDIYRQLSSMIGAESSCEKSQYRSILYNELLLINEMLNDKIGINKKKLTWANTRYLYLVGKHYFLDNHPVLLLSDIMRDQKFFFKQIKRFIKYVIFDDWITMKSQISLKSRCLANAESVDFHMTELYAIFLMELNQSGLIKYVEKFVNTESMPKEEDERKTVTEFLREKFLELAPF